MARGSKPHFLEPPAIEVRGAMLSHPCLESLRADGGVGLPGASSEVGERSSGCHIPIGSFRDSQMKLSCNPLCRPEVELLPL